MLEMFRVLGATTKAARMFRWQGVLAGSNPFPLSYEYLASLVVQNTGTTTKESTPTGHCRYFELTMLEAPSRRNRFVMHSTG